MLIELKRTRLNVFSALLFYMSRVYKSTFRCFKEEKKLTDGQEQATDEALAHSSSSMSSLASSSATTTGSSSNVDGNNNHVTQNIRQTVVEKCGDILKQSTATNTVLVTGGGLGAGVNKGKNNESDELYSLKITFV